MITNDGQKVRTCNAIVLWDGITQPDTDDRTGQLVHSLKVAIPKNAPECAELEQLATKCLQESAFKGQLPPGGNWPLREIDMAKYGDSASVLQGHIETNAKTRMGVPQIFDTNGNQLDATQFGRMLYPGCVVQVLVHAYAFNNVSKGVAFGLDGILIADHTTPKLDVGGGMSSAEMAEAFGFGAATPPPDPAPAAAPAPAASAPSNDAFAAGAAAPPPSPEAAPPPAPAPAPAPSGPRMTAKAAGVPYESFVAKGWTDEMLIQQGYMEQ